jgi:hypothetical protein
LDKISTADIIRKIEDQEAAANSKVNKILKIKPLISTTSELAGNITLPTNYPDSYTIKRNRLFEGIALFLIAGVFTYFVVSQFLKDHGGNFYFNLFGFPFLLFCYYAFYKNLTLKFINYSIIVSKENLRISEKVYSWADIQELFIVYRPQGQVHYLIVGLKDSELNRYHISNFITFTRSDKKIATIIETYRQTTHNMWFCAIGA